MNRKKEKDDGSYFQNQGTDNEFTLMELDLKNKRVNEKDINVQTIFHFEDEKKRMEPVEVQFVVSHDEKIYTNRKD